jgi:uncharacterized membrane protein YbhN (UPF0104 family)
VNDTAKRLLRHAPAVLGFALLGGAIYVVAKEFRGIRIEDIARVLKAMPIRALVVAFAWNIVAYLVLTLYDRLGTIYAGHKVRYRKVAFASFCAYTLGHNLGFAAVSGAAVRYRLYAHWGLAPLEIAKVVAFCSFTFGLGGMVLGGVVLLVEPEAVPFFGHLLPAWAMHLIGVALWAVVAAYVAASRLLGGRRMFGHRVELPGWRMAIAQVVLASVDVAVTAAILYELLPAAPGLTYLRFLGVYVASYSAGLAASIPGGIGVFDTAMLVGLAPWLQAPDIVGAIVVYRLYYYIIPLFLAGGLFAGNEIVLRSRALLAPAPTLRGFAPAARWSEPDFVVAAVTGVVALCGALLLCIGVLERRPDFSWIDPDFAEVASQAGEFVPSLIGGALMVLALAMSQRVALAWGVTIALLVAAAAFTYAQDEPLWIPGVLVVAAGLIAPFRGAFYRHARLLTGRVEGSVATALLTLVGCILLLAAFEPHVRWLADSSWWEVVISPLVPNSLRATVAFTVVLAGLAAWRLLRPGRVGYQVWGVPARERYAALGADPPAEASGIVWSDTGRAGIPFRRTRIALVGIGDPAGAESECVSAIWRLRDLARQEGIDAAFWRVGRIHLKVYADLGLAALPLGADGLGLPGAEESAGPHASSYLVCRAEHALAALLPVLEALAADHSDGRPAPGYSVPGVR